MSLTFSINDQRNVFLRLNEELYFFNDYKDLEDRVFNKSVKLNDEQLHEIEVALMEIIELELAEKLKRVACLHDMQCLEVVIGNLT